MDEDKMTFATFLANTIYLGMNDCERYGMMAGCDTGCPVLQAGKCELKDDENKELYQEFLNSQEC